MAESHPKDSEYDKPQNQNYVDDIQSCAVPKPPPKKENVTAFQISILNILKNPPIDLKRTELADDSDRQFLLSFLLDIKRLTEDQKVEFKFKFHQLVRNSLRSSTTTFYLL